MLSRAALASIRLAATAICLLTRLPTPAMSVRRLAGRWEVVHVDQIEQPLCRLVARTFACWKRLFDNGLAGHVCATSRPYAARTRIP